MTTESKRWQDLLPGAFDYMIGPFGIHPSDHERAECMFHLALRQGATIVDILEEAKLYLQSKGCNKQWIDKELKHIKNFRSRAKSYPKSTRAWLITLEGKTQKTEVVSMFNSRKSPNYIREYIEQYYIDRFYSEREKIIYLSSRKYNPYPAESMKIEGINWGGRFFCGNDPFLYGRLVKNLHIDKSSTNSVLKWEELEIPQSIFENLTDKKIMKVITVNPS